MTQPALVEPIFLMNYPGPEIDYRPVVDPTGQYVIFERTILGNCNLYILDLATTARVPTPYVPSVDGSSRPDWSKALGVVAFCNKDGIWFAQGTGGTDPWLLSETSNMIYPAWYPSGKNLLVMNNQQSTTGPSPRTTKILDEARSRSKSWQTGSSGAASLRSTRSIPRNTCSPASSSRGKRRTMRI
jgi:hypothetical protein